MNPVNQPNPLKPTNPVSEPFIKGVKSRRMAFVRFSDRFFLYACLTGILLLCAVLASVIFFIGKTGLLTFGDVAVTEFLFSLEWDPENDKYGAAVFIIGTLSLTALTLLISVPLSIGMSIFVAEIAPKWMKGAVRTVLDLLVGIPSVVYGFLGLTILVPLIRDTTGSLMGDGLLAAALVLTLMILPTICRISDDSITAVPRSYREAAYALGSTRTQVIFRVVLPAAKRGILTAVILGMARALGETMAVVMVIGNTAQLAKSLFTPTSVLTSNIVMQVSNVEFDSTWNYALYMMAFLLLVISLVLIMALRILRRKGDNAV